MPQHVARKSPRAAPPGGRRISRAEVEQRMDFADRMLQEGRTRAEVVAAMARTFGASCRSADSYIARARARWAEEAKGAREVEREAAVQRLLRLSARAEKRGAFAAAVAAERLRAQITGLMAPLEVKATVGPTPTTPEMTLEQALDELSTIEETLRMARQSASVRPKLESPPPVTQS